jgi:tetratricopeptide (TPR) repeat protein
VLARCVARLLVIGIATLAGPAHAQECGPRERAAMLLTQRAREEFREARHARAVELLEEALALCPQPIIVFNLGRVHHESGELRAARDDFRRYLEMRPDAEDRDEVERRLRTIEVALAEEDALARAARESEESARSAREDAERVRRAAAESEHRAQPGPWVLGASGLIVLGAAVGLGVGAMVEANVGPDVDHLRASRAEERAQALALSANIGFALGGAVLLAGVIWEIAVLVTAPAIELEVRAGPLGVSLEGRY